MGDTTSQRQAVQASIIELIFVLLTRLGHINIVVPPRIDTCSLEQLVQFRHELLDYILRLDIDALEGPNLKRL